MSSGFVAAEVFPPGEHLSDELVARGWTTPRFAEMIGCPVQVVSGILYARIEITQELAAVISAALGTSAQLWLNLERSYRSHAATQDAEGGADIVDADIRRGDFHDEVVDGAVVNGAHT